MQKVLVCCDATFGDSGKAKVVDYFCSEYDLCIRSSGSSNAGHTVVIDNNKYKLHLVPAGILSNKACLLSSGMVIDLEELYEELIYLRNEGFNISQVFISRYAFVKLSTHKILDQKWEIIKSNYGQKKIGTTGKGIGPAYADKAARCGIQFWQLFEKKELDKQIEFHLNLHANNLLGTSGCSFQELKSNIQNNLKKLETIINFKTNLIDPTFWIIGQGDIIIEGSQGTFLSNTFGTYPYVTSTDVTAPRLLADTHIPVTCKDFKIKTLIITKAYNTRVGSGPMIGELSGQEAEDLRQKGYEFGTTTGRPRRVGWLNIDDLQKASMLNGANYLAINKCDILAGIDKINIVTDNKDLIAFDGWQKADMSDFNFNYFIKMLEQYLRIPVSFIGIGSDRNDVIIRSTVY